MAKSILLMAAISGVLAVAIGAFGAHGIKGRVAAELLVVYQTGVQYHFYHSLALLAAGLLLLHYPQASLLFWSGLMFVAGIVLFSGSLYLLVLTDTRWLGAITPLGGLAFIAGWLSMAVAIYRNVSE